MVFEKTLESPLDCSKIKEVNPKGNQPQIFIGRTDAEAVILWSPDMKNRLIGKDPGKTEGKRRMGRQRMKWLGSITSSMDMNLSRRQWRTEEPGVLQSMGS